MKELITRFKSKTPKLFKRIRNISLSLATACGSAALAYSQLPASMTSMVPEQLMQTVAISAVVAAFIAQLTKEDPTEPLAQ